MLEIAKFNEAISIAYKEMSPHRICQYIYEIADSFNTFYHGNRIIDEEDEEKKASWVSLITIVRDVLLTCIDLLAIEAPDKM